MSTEEVKQTTETEATTEASPIEASATHKETRAEKNMKAALLKFNLKKLEKVSTVTIRRGINGVFSFANPEVYYVGDVYVVFGETQSASVGSQLSNLVDQPEASAEEEAKPVVADDENVDATGLDENDIKTIMEQGNVSRSRAVHALREADGDVVNAVMKLAL